MKRLGVGIGVLCPLILGILAGGLGTTLFFSQKVTQRELKQPDGLPGEVKQRDWLRNNLYHTRCRWCYLKVDGNGWFTTSVNNLSTLQELINTSATDTEMVIPLFPTVYAPDMDDALYYNTILASDIKQGDKVLVIGTGSGSDAWVAWLKSQSLVYVVEANPMAIANAKTTARLGNFQIKPILGDIRVVDLPEDFSNFDFVLWNMPFFSEKATIDDANFHDGDDGSILKCFLKLLPSLLKRDGQAIILNTADSSKLINLPNSPIKRDGSWVYIISNNAAEPPAGLSGQ